jgi:hypothetical protein
VLGVTEIKCKKKKTRGPPKTFLIVRSLDFSVPHLLTELQIKPSVKRATARSHLLTRSSHWTVVLQSLDGGAPVTGRWRSSH